MLLGSLPAILLDGAKAVGKTATALQRSTSRFLLDRADTRAIVDADVGRLLSAHPPVLVDEWQRMPRVWDEIRRAVDAGVPAASFLLTGSATPPGDVGSHSGAGRIVTVRMRPLSLAERWPGEATVSLTELLEGHRPAVDGQTTRRLADYAAEIVQSGFPGLRDLEDRALRAQLDGYLDRIVDRDFPELGLALRNPAALRRWLRAYAAATATTASFETIRDAASAGHAGPPARTTVGPYRDVLERLFILDEVPGWVPTHNPLSTLTVSPKHHLVDPALAARLLGVGVAGLINPVAPARSEQGAGPLLGRLFESLLTQSVRVYAQHAEVSVRHLRTKRGDREIDLILERGDGRILALEVKLSAGVDDGDVRHLNWLADRLGDALADRIILTTGAYAYRRLDGVAVVPAALLGP